MYIINYINYLTELNSAIWPYSADQILPFTYFSYSRFCLSSIVHPVALNIPLVIKVCSRFSLVHHDWKNLGLKYSDFNVYGQLYYIIQHPLGK